MLKRILAGMLLFSLGLGALGSQEANEWFVNKPLREIRFEGLRTVSRTELDNLMRPFIGEPFTPELFRRLQTILYGLDYFEGLIVPNAQEIDAERTMVRLVFSVTEKPAIRQIRFEGNSRYSAADLQGQISLKERELVNPGKLRLDERALANYYIERGYPSVAVLSRQQAVENESHLVDLIFSIEEGSQIIVRTVNFQGLSFASANALRDQMRTRPAGFLESGVFQELRLTEDLQALRSYYWDRGYVDAEIVNVERTLVPDPDQNRNFLDLTITLREGDYFVFGGFTFNGNVIFTDEELQSLVRHPLGQAVRRQRIEQDYGRILDKYYENGYIFNPITRREQRADNVLSYIIDIQERGRAHIGNILITGNTKTRPEVILRELPLEVGEVFSKTKLVEGLRNLLNTQYFTNIVPETPMGEAEQLMDLVLNVEEAQTMELLFGLSFSGSTEFPVALNAKWNDRNFLGNGQSFGAELNISPAAQSLSLNFTENWLFGRRLSVGLSLSAGHYLRSGLEQDVQFPIYSDRYLPDPYTDTEFVFTENMTVPASRTGSTDLIFSEGTSWPFGVPSASDIATYKLKLKYQYDLEKGQSQSLDTTMSYDSYELGLGLNTGYVWSGWFGRLGYRTGLSTSLQYVTYNDSYYRPANALIRENLNKALFENSWTNQVYHDTRDFILNPTSGTYLSQTMNIFGGFLGGKTHLVRTDSKGELYFKLADAELADWYRFQLVFKAKTQFSFIHAPLGNEGLIAAQPKDLLFLDGMWNSRGWRPLRNGYGLWTQNMEFRMPVVDQLLWFDAFFDGALMVGNTGQIFDRPLENYQFSLGAGLRIVNPQLPLAFYLTRPFRITDQGWTWEKGDGIFGPDLDLRLVIGFGLELY